jgi:hypothetical protein
MWCEIGNAYHWITTQNDVHVVVTRKGLMKTAFRLANRITVLPSYAVKDTK